jgi:hypothetical protein
LLTENDERIRGTLRGYLIVDVFAVTRSGGAE